jgi:putative inorganic carbon (HCO3(-)) transporter
LLVQKCAPGAPSRRTPLDWPLLGLALMMLLSLYATFSIALSAPCVTGLILGLGTFYIIARFGQSPKGWWLSLAFFAALGLGVAGAALFGMRWSTKIAVLSALANRLPSLLLGVPGIGTRANPNEVAGILVWVIPVLAVVGVDGVVHASAWRKALGEKRAVLANVLVVCVTLFALAVFVLTQSRGGYLALGLVGLGLAWLAVPSRWRGVALAGAVVVGAVSLVAFWQTGAAAELFASAALRDQTGLSVESLPGRLEIWSRAIYAIEDFPFTGIGMNTFQPTVNLLYPLFLFGTASDVFHAHNEFLQAALDLGVPGLIAFVALYIDAFWMVVTIGRGEARWRTLGLGLGGGLLAHLFWGFTDCIYLGSASGPYFWLLLGLIAGLYMQAVAGSGSEGAVPEQKGG